MISCEHFSFTVGSINYHLTPIPPLSYRLQHFKNMEKISKESCILLKKNIYLQMIKKSQNSN